MFISQSCSCVGVPSTNRPKTPQSNVNTLILFLLAIMLLVHPVISLEESFCAGTGWHNVYKRHMPSVGYRTAGWDRLHAVNAPWTSYFWSVPSKDSDLATGNPVPKLTLSLLEYKDQKTQKSHVLNGWLHLHLERTQAKLHYAAIWAVNHRNEPYGSFILTDANNLVDCSSGHPVHDVPSAYVPCSAGTSNADTVSNMFVFADLTIRQSNSSNKNSIVEANVDSRRQDTVKLSVLWSAPAQTYCNRPEKFRFLFATTPKVGWENYATDWNSAVGPGEMWEGRDTGPVLRTSEWISPSFYGHPSNPSFHSSSDKLKCVLLSGNKEWPWIISHGNYPPLDQYWYSTEVWPLPYPGRPVNKDGNYAAEDPKKRSTCKGLRPTDNFIEGFGGRCTSHVSPGHLSYHISSHNAGLRCPDENKALGQGNFTKHYDYGRKGSYLDDLKARLKSTCECNIVTNQIVSLKILMQPPPLPWHPGVSRSVKLRASHYTGEYHRDHDICSIDRLNVSTAELHDRGGICVQTPVGKLVYGVRQFHGVTSLCATIIITPFSIFIARYTKGEMVLLDGKVRIRSWYLTHLVLVFPAIWMYASGMATISRQVDVLGHSLTYAASLHRTVGIFTIGLIPFHVVTGFIRPVNLKARNVFIFLHWFGGLFYHFLELLLCCFSFLIPASPTTKSSVFSRHSGNLFRSSRVSTLVVGWFVFSIFFNILLTVRIWCHDRKMGNAGRSVFPIIIPLFTRDARQDLVDAEHSHELCFERGALFIYALVSFIVFAVSVVSLYQALHEKLYYGFGPMSCTHNVFGEFISDNHTESEFINDECHR